MTIRTITKKPLLTALLAGIALAGAATASFAQTAPSWAKSLTPGTWTAIGSNKLMNVDPEDDAAANPNYPSGAPWRGSTGQASVIQSWNGGVLARNYGPSGSLILYGGGHSNYYGSEVYAFDLATATWKRLTNPFRGPLNWPYATGDYPDGSALPPHTCDFVEYDPLSNSMVLLKGQNELGPPSNNTAISVVHAFDFDTKTWRRSQMQSGLTIYSGGYSAYDSKRQVFWAEGGASSNGFVKFDPKPQNSDGTFGSWTTYPKIVTRTNAVATYDPAHDLILVAGFREGPEVFAIDPNNVSGGRTALKEVGAAPTKEQASGWEWSTLRGSIIYWRRGAGVYELKLQGTDWKAGSWEWSNLTVGANSVTPQEMEVDNGPFSRFRLINYGDGTEVAVVVNRPDGPVYAFRMPDVGQRPKAPTNVTAE
ncbi:MAG TPA: hypothetical protein VH814_10695 [Steroidobacteraceae bacterium]|jgi:hypothetical protein